MPEAEGGVSLPSEADLKNLPQDERLKQAAQAAQAAASAEGIVNTLKQKAAAITNPKERERILREAYSKEIEAKGLSKKARILQSGGFQGAVGGAGIGAATAAGLGTVVGTLVGTVTTIPTSLVGGLVGTGVGMFHGPWIKLSGGGKDGDGSMDKFMQIPQQAIDSGAVLVDQLTGSVTVKDPDALKDAAAAAEQAAEVSAAQDNQQDQPQGQQSPAEKKKPRKLEVRSNKDAAAGATSPSLPSSTPSTPQPQTEDKVRRKPRKLEVRSKKAPAAA